MKKNLSVIILFLVFFVGLSVLLYPAISDYWNSRVQSRAIFDYENTLANMTKEDYSGEFAKADEYNEQLRSVSFPLMNYEQVEGYNDILNLGGQNIIGYISIEKIGVELPIYHGTGDSILSFAAGHLQGTSFPVGGESTHSVISAHRGLPSAVLFTHLDRLEIGDTFVITVLDRILTYEVDQILIVDPKDFEPLYIIEGEDHCTLLTCTPYGINSHRLLVRGVQIDASQKKPKIYISNEAYQIDPRIVTPLFAMPMLMVAFVVLMVKYNKKKK